MKNIYYSLKMSISMAINIEGAEGGLVK